MIPTKVMTVMQGMIWGNSLHVDFQVQQTACLKSKFTHSELKAGGYNLVLKRKRVMHTPDGFSSIERLI
ncbi:hypothetical protein L596_028563 [Steinernema carpocapsae]|uniref:Uncharacterized protein n=1 Tax=Steinernema carpocapsae TaxID=34508 RepID=A0A4U5LYS2_STECR|nr:hypothetical protein L596_028563 [Steinernema carpocapsae]